jgi:hypothetical protein
MPGSAGAGAVVPSKGGLAIKKVGVGGLHVNDSAAQAIQQQPSLPASSCGVKAIQFCREATSRL